MNMFEHTAVFRTVTEQMTSVTGREACLKKEKSKNKKKKLKRQKEEN